MTGESSLYTALLAAQRAMGPVKKDATNPAFKTRYASLQSVLETIEGPLSENGLVLLQRFDVGAEGPVLITEIVHAETGDRVSSAVPIVGKDPTDPQKMGGAITYYRRYSLLALLGLAPEDDDGNSAAQPRPAPRPTTPRQIAPDTRQRRTDAPDYFSEVRDPDEGMFPADYSPTLVTDKQEQVFAEAWDMATQAQPYPAVVSHLRQLQADATPDQWTAIRRALAAIKAKHYANKEA